MTLEENMKSLWNKYLETKDINLSIIYANKMASIVVSKRGVTTPWKK